MKGGQPLSLTTVGNVSLSARTNLLHYLALHTCLLRNLELFTWLECGKRIWLVNQLGLPWNHQELTSKIQFHHGLRPLSIRLVGMSRKVIFKEYVPLVSILEATTVVVGDDFGDVKEGTIRMRCRLPFIAGVVEEHDNTWFIIRLGLYGPAFNFSLCPDRTRYSVGQELYFLPLFRGIVPDSDLQLRKYGRQRDKLICGLVIELVQPGSFRRTGLFMTWGDTEIEGVLKTQKGAS
jgi:hypothetical protein